MGAASKMKVDDASTISRKPNWSTIGAAAVDFSHRCFSLSLLSFGFGLVTNNGFISSLSMAGSTAKSYAVLSSIYCNYEAMLTSLREKHDFINAGFAGCCLGVLRCPSLGPKLHLGIPHLVNCMFWGTFGIASFNIFHWRSYKQAEKASQTCDSKVVNGRTNNTCSLLSHKRPRSALVSCIKLFAGRLILAATLGTILGYGEKGLIASFQVANSSTKFCAIAGGILTCSLLFFWELHGKDIGLKLGLYGATSFLFSSQAYCNVTI